MYFVVKGIVLLILFKYDNYLKNNQIYIVPFVLLLLINTYMMLTAGKDPGFEPMAIEEN